MLFVVVLSFVKHSRAFYVCFFLFHCYCCNWKFLTSVWCNKMSTNFFIFFIKLLQLTFSFWYQHFFFLLFVKKWLNDTECNVHQISLWFCIFWLLWFVNECAMVIVLSHLSVLLKSFLNERMFFYFVSVFFFFYLHCYWCNWWFLPTMM